MRFARRLAFLSIFIVSLAQGEALPPGPGPYAQLLEVHAEYRQLVQASLRDGVEDWSSQVVAAKRQTLRALQQRHQSLASAQWDRAGQVDWLLVRSLLDGFEFRLTVARPWARDPGYYVDQLLRVTFAQVPAEGTARAELEQKLARVPTVLQRAREQLTSPAGDFVAMALYNLTMHDGVGHGHPYRTTPPAGVIGWYDDLLRRVQQHQPELAATVLAARDAVVSFEQWLRQGQSQWTAPAGVGQARFDWYLHHVKLIPLDGEALLTLGEREYERLTSALALERHRNRAVAPLTLASSAEDYQERIRAADEHIRRFIVERDILTIPDYVGELATNVPWTARPGGPNFWEQIQYRDPRPDHVHAVIPGHRFDWAVAERQQHPLRAGYWEGARVEGWAVYLEEMMLATGLLEDYPRTRELFHIFGIKRAVRVRADIEMQRNRMTVSDATEYMRQRVPFLDEDVARVDAEIYLRRPPGYGLGYLIGMLQLQALLADRAHQLGERFVLRDFHDDFLAAGRLPISLIRYEMTGYEDELERLLARAPIPLAVPSATAQTTRE